MPGIENCARISLRFIRADGISRYGFAASAATFPNSAEMLRWRLVSMLT